MPVAQTVELKKKRTELDQHESNYLYLENAERAYLEVAQRYHFHIIECGTATSIRSIEEINDELFAFLKSQVVS